MADERLQINCEEGPQHCNLYGVPHNHRTPAPRRRLTKDEWEAELARAKGVQAADVERSQDLNLYRTRTGRRRSWWQRGWKR